VKYLKKYENPNAIRYPDPNSSVWWSEKNCIAFSYYCIGEKWHMQVKHELNI